DTVGVTHRIVSKWAQRFLHDGLEGLADKLGRGRRPAQTTPGKDEQARGRKRAQSHSRHDSHRRASRSARPRGRKTALTISLTPEERATLTRWQRSTTIPAGYAKRGRLISC